MKAIMNIFKKRAEVNFMSVVINAMTPWNPKYYNVNRYIWTEDKEDYFWLVQANIEKNILEGVA